MFVAHGLGSLLVTTQIVGRQKIARAEFERAASLTRNARERTLLLERAAACARGSEAWRTPYPVGS